MTEIPHREPEFHHAGRPPAAPSLALIPIQITQRTANTLIRLAWGTPKDHDGGTQRRIRNSAARLTAITRTTAAQHYRHRARRTV